MKTGIDATYADREAAARRWKSAGGKVVGVLGATVPVELIAAADMLPVRLVGDPSIELRESLPYMEPVREGYLRSIFEKLMTGRYDYLDLLVIPRSSEGLLQFYYLLKHVQENEPERRLPEVYLFDLLQKPSEPTRTYVRARVLDLKSKLAGLSGNAMEDRAILDAIGQCNRARRSFRSLNALRSARPPGLNGETALKAAACGQVLPVDAFHDLLGSNPPEDESRAGVRLMVKGSPVEHADLYRTIEAMGATIVADDHDWGEGIYAHDVDETRPWLEALTDHYMNRVPGPRRFPQDKVDAEFMAKVADAQVEGVIFFLEENDDTLGWDYPAQKRMLDAAGIRSLLLTRQTYWLLDEGSMAAIGTFIGEIGQ